MAWRRGSAVLALLAALTPSPGVGVQPRLSAHFLTKHELFNITSVNCLQAKQQDPNYRCQEENYSSPFVFSGKISAGNFPDYQDAACNSVDDEYFCDPSTMLSVEERGILAGELKRLREDHLVTCGALLNDKVDPRHLQPFYLGVVLLSGWPVREADPESLQQLGQIVSAQWNMDKKYAGVPPGRLTCPNTGLLLVLPDLRQAYLSTGSCEFICQARGGPEVVTATIKNWNNNKKLDGVLDGIRVAYKILGEPRSPMKDVASPELASQESVPHEPSTSDSSGSMFNVLQRVIFVFVVILFALSLVIGMALLLLGPGLLPGRRKR